MIDMERVYAYVRRKKAEAAEKDTQIISLTSERDTLQELHDTIQAKFERLNNMTFWAELDSGKTIDVGTVVRYFGRYYKCVKAHTKALLRLPTNGEYWEAAE